MYYLKDYPIASAIMVASANVLLAPLYMVDMCIAKSNSYDKKLVESQI
jgi:hypothetical protein